MAAGESFRVYGANGKCIAVLDKIPLSTGGSSAFLGVVASKALSRVFFDEDEASDDVAVRDFQFGFKEHKIEVGFSAWIIFGVFAAFALAVDLTCASSEQLQSSLWVALAWSGAWVAAALLFNFGIWWFFGSEWALLFLAGWTLEEMLSIDNLFVFLLIFKSFKVPVELQHRALLYGVLLSILFRAAFILFGTMLLQRFRIALAAFGIFLVYSGIKSELGSGDDEEDAIGFQAFAHRALGCVGVPMADEDSPDGAFCVLVSDPEANKSRWMATPQLAVLLSIAVADVVFALDSIPAILTITTDRFVVITSNAFAVLGLRTLFWVLASLDSQFDFIQHILAFMLTAAGGKLMLAYFEVHLEQRWEQVAFVAVVAGGLWALRIVTDRRRAQAEKELREL